MYDSVIRTLLAHERGTDAVPTRATPPPHLCDREWKFSCACGYAWKLHATDAVWRDGQWRSPRRECLNCHTWQDGSVIDR